MTRKGEGREKEMGMGELTTTEDDAKTRILLLHPYYIAPPITPEPRQGWTHAAVPL